MHRDIKPANDPQYQPSLIMTILAILVTMLTLGYVTSYVLFGRERE